MNDRRTMLGWGLLFLVFSLVAGLFGFGLVATHTIAKVMFFVFFVLFLVAVLTQPPRRI